MQFPWFLRKYEKITLLDAPKNTFPEVFHLKLHFLHLMPYGLNESIIDIDCGFIIIFHVIYLVKAHNNFYYDHDYFWKFENKILLNELAQL